MQAVKEKMEMLYKQSNEFTSVASQTVFVKGDTDILLSICPLHAVTERDADFWSLSELNKFYDNYSYKQVDEMLATGNYPMHLTALYRNDKQKTILVDTDADVCLTSVEELTEMVQERISFKGIK